MSLGRVVKDPSDVRIWAFDWSAFLAVRGATLSSSTWAVSAGLTKDAEANTTTVATVKISGGTAREDYQATNTVVLSNGETIEKSIDIAVRQQ